MKLSRVILLLFCTPHSSSQAYASGTSDTPSSNSRWRNPSTCKSDAETKASFLFSGQAQNIDATTSSRKKGSQLKASSEDKDPAADVAAAMKAAKTPFNTHPPTFIQKAGAQDSTSAFQARMKIFSVVDKYNLIWSPGAWQKFGMTSFLFFLVHQYAKSQISQGNLVVDWNRVFQSLPKPVSFTCVFGVNVALPLFASACCLIQLIINVVAGGCAGFNRYLGPYRPFFLGFLFYLTYQTRSKASFLKHTLRWIVALLPELVHLWNKYEESKVIATNGAATILSGGDVSGMEEVTQDRNIAPSSWPYRATVKLDVPSMGCVACISSIDNALRTVVPANRLLQASSELKPFGEAGGEATLQFLCESEDEVGTIVQSVLQAVDEAGFGEKTRVESVKLQKNSKQSKQKG